MKIAWGRTVLLALVLTAGTAWGGEMPPPGDKARCPVCGMFVAPFASWLAAIQFSDGSEEFFDGPKDLFVFLFDLDTYKPQPNPPAVSGVYVTEYYTTRLLPAKGLFFVLGSDVRGPMGDELVPVQGRDNVETFRNDHGGTKIMQFDGEKLNELPSSP